MNITYEEALAVCVQYYVDRGYSVEHATDYVKHTTQGIFWLYDIIQEEKRTGNVATVLSLTQPDSRNPSEILVADG